MKKVSHVITSISSLLLTAISLAVLSSCGGKEPDMFEKVVTDDMEPHEVLNALNGVIMHDKFIPYKNASYHFEKTDADPNVKGNIFLYYTGESYEVTLGSYGTGDEQLNVEHVWCQSRFRCYSNNPNANDYETIRVPTPYSDLYNIRPCMGKVNTDRSNYMYAENTEKGSLNPFDPKNYPGCKEEYRGDIARILFYDATRYLKLKLIDSISASTSNSFEMGQLSDLLEWNLKYAPSEMEKRRSDEIEKIQGNRNPFVDHPEYACRIWGLTNEKTQQICGIK